MSVVIAIKDKKSKSIVIGCDKQVTLGNGMKKEIPSKIFDIKNCERGILGSTGLVRGMQILQVQDNLIDEMSQLKGEVDFKYCVTTLFERIYGLFLKYRLVDKKDGEYANYLPNSFILAYKDNAFSIDSYGCVEEIDDFLVIGSGYETAYAVLSQNKSKSPEDRIREAIKACSENTLYVNNNVIIKRT